MCSVGRASEPERFMSSLAQQTHTDFELIIVDQNQDERLVPLVAKYMSSFTIRHLRSYPGLSRARNVGLQHVRGDVVAFPDDDCWYSKELLAGVCKRFESVVDCSAICVQRADNETSLCVSNPLMRLTRFNLWGKAPSISLFMRRPLVEAVGPFDETLGVGAGTPWGAGEDTDYVLRALSLGAYWLRDPTLRVFHAAPNRKVGDVVGRLRARSYARGLGRVLRKHQLPFWMVLGGCALSASRVCSAVVRGNVMEARWHLEALVGRAEGWLCYGDIDRRAAKVK
ncbi:MAG: glycosyltransferase family A protein [Telluria sp.]|nr:glycosyltransferase family A protein [Telluria sp.]